MKVFEFSYDVDYGSGVMLIAAESFERARKIAFDVPTGFGHWEFSYEHTELSYNGEGENIILQESWFE
jgi:hypothetical protein